MIEEIGASTGRSTCGGSVPDDERELFGDELAGDVDVGAPVELDPDDADADRRRGADAAHAGRRR